MGKLRSLIATVVWIACVAFLLSGFLHTGQRVPFLPAFFHNPSINGALEVEGACGVILGSAALLISVRHQAAWWTTVIAVAFAIVADSIGMILITVGAGPVSPFNFWFHRIGVAVLAVVLVVLLTSPGKEALHLPMREWINGEGQAEGRSNNVL
jgi:uncharacterized membrane protein